ncbi:MAG TPA: tetratricopeptide repeat protein [Ktedonobacteraceae bacterium]|nr:tetratricopeptide repeat protein [Ktedonobacteraceae bacterium]
MELTLDLENGTLVRVLCDQQFSHTFDLRELVLANEEAVQALRAKPDEYGKKLYTALFPRETVARRTFEGKPDRLLLVALQEAVDAIPWEYTYGLSGRENQADDFLVLSLPFVRGLPPDQRRVASVSGEGLHIIAVPSSPLSRATEQLPIERDWTLLQEVIEDVPRVVTLERCRPPTLKRLRELIANQVGRVIHFIGHGGQREEGAILCFEQENGDLDAVTTQRLLKRLQDTAFLVTLSACESAASGPTTWNNVAASLARQGVPYTLGMRLSVYDVDARTFFRSFYSELARGSSVEQALFQARLVLAEDSPRGWVVGVPVLYTSLAAPAAGRVCQPGTPVIKASDPLLNVDVLPPTDGPFQGRLEELVKLGTVLTNPRPASLFTIHGAGGQGKTALARQAAERFAWAWPGGVWALSLETAQTRAAVVQEMARLLGLETQGITDRGHMENLVQQRLQRRRTLFLLDNAETLLDALQQNSAEARAVVAWLKHLLSKQSTYLVTSRELLTWPDEQYLELPGLQPDDGATLFLRCATPRANEADRAALRALSHRLDGHPLSLRLLARVFGETQQSLEELLASAEAQLVQAHDTYLGPEHRHYKLYACIEVSVRALEPDLRAILSALWIFHTPFLAQTAIAVLDPETEETEEQQSAVRTALHQLWKRSLLTSQTISVRDGSLHVYALLPTTRPYIEAHLEQGYERSALLSRFGQACFSLTRWVYDELDRGPAASVLTQHIHVDLDRGWQYLGEEDGASYLRLWGWILYRLGSVAQGLERLELALERAQEGERPFFASVVSTLALVYHGIGQPKRALELYEQALPVMREVGDRAGEAATLSNLALVYHGIGQPKRALELYEQALPIMREVGDRAGEAATLNGMAFLYQDVQRYTEALDAFDASIHLEQDVSHVPGEIAGLVGRALLLYRHLSRAEDALRSLEHAQALFRSTGLSHDAAGRTPEQVEQLLVTVRNGKPLSGNQASATLPPALFERLVENTIAVLSLVPERRPEWEKQVEKLLAHAREQGADWQQEVELFTALLALLDDQEILLPTDHPYASVLEAIQQGSSQGAIASSIASDAFLQAIREFLNTKDWPAAKRVVEAHQEALFRPEVEQVFLQNIAQAQQAGEEQRAKLLEMHLAVLLACQRDGIEPTFASLLAQTDEQP